MRPTPDKNFELTIFRDYQTRLDILKILKNHQPEPTPTVLRPQTIAHEQIKKIVPFSDDHIAEIANPTEQRTFCNIIGYCCKTFEKLSPQTISEHTIGKISEAFVSILQEMQATIDTTPNNLDDSILADFYSFLTDIMPESAQDLTNLIKSKSTRNGFTWDNDQSFPPLRLAFNQENLRQCLEYWNKQWEIKKAECTQQFTNAKSTILKAIADGLFKQIG